METALSMRASEMDEFDLSFMISSVSGTPNFNAISLILSWLAVISADVYFWAIDTGAMAGVETGAATATGFYGRAITGAATGRATGTGAATSF